MSDHEASHPASQLEELARYRELATEKALSRVLIGDGCWIWPGRKTNDGYGIIRIAPRRIVDRAEVVHRLLYELLRGPIPTGLQLDHYECDTPSCVNPWHLKPSTGAENNARSQSPSARNARKTQCPSGHPYDDDNTWRDKRGKRYCRECMRASARRWRAGRKASA